MKTRVSLKYFVNDCGSFRITLLYFIECSTPLTMKVFLYERLIIILLKSICPLETTYPSTYHVVFCNHFYCIFFDVGGVVVIAVFF